MKHSKLITPILLYLMILLLMIALYFNLVFNPLRSKSDALAWETQQLKTERMEIELAMIEKDKIREDIDGLKTILKEDKELTLIDGMGLTDDINAKAALEGISLQDLVISDAELFQESSDPSKSLLVVKAVVRFSDDLERAIAFMDTFERSSTGAYMIDGLKANKTEAGTLMFELSFSLYYYGDAASVKPPETAEGEAPATAPVDLGGETWTQ